MTTYFETTADSMKVDKYRSYGRVFSVGLRIIDENRGELVGDAMNILHLHDAGLGRVQCRNNIERCSLSTSLFRHDKHILAVLGPRVLINEKSKSKRIACYYYQSLLMIFVSSFTKNAFNIRIKD